MRSESGLLDRQENQRPKVACAEQSWFLKQRDIYCQQRPKVSSARQMYLYFWVRIRKKTWLWREQSGHNSQILGHTAKFTHFPKFLIGPWKLKGGWLSERRVCDTSGGWVGRRRCRVVIPREKSFCGRARDVAVGVIDSTAGRWLRRLGRPAAATASPPIGRASAWRSPPSVDR